MNNKKQHYVPQFYLRNFSHNDQLFVFDIKSEKKYVSNIKDINCENLFYDIEPQILSSFINDDVNSKFIDDTIRLYSENISAPFIRMFNKIPEIIDDIKKHRVLYLDDSSIDIISRFAIIQFFRTPKFRDTFNEIVEIMKKQFISLKLYPNMSNDFYLSFVHNLYILIALHQCFGLDNTKFSDDLQEIELLVLDDIKGLKSSLSNAAKVFFISDCSKRFFTSDNPVAVNFVRGEKDLLKLAILPLSDIVSIMFINKDYCPVEYKNISVNIRLVHPGEEHIIDNINLFMVNDAYQRVFSMMDDFELAKLFIKKEIKCKIAFL